MPTAVPRAASIRTAPPAAWPGTRQRSASAARLAARSRRPSMAPPGREPRSMATGTSWASCALLGREGLALGRELPCQPIGVQHLAAQAGRHTGKTIAQRDRLPRQRQRGLRPRARPAELLGPHGRRCSCSAPGTAPRRSPAPGRLQLHRLDGLHAVTGGGKGSGSGSGLRTFVRPGVRPRRADERCEDSPARALPAARRTGAAGPGSVRRDPVPARVVGAAAGRRKSA